MTDVRDRRVTLRPTTLEHLDAYFRDPAELSELLGSPLPSGWPIDPNAFLWIANSLETAPSVSHRWMRWAFDADTGRLVGDGGFRPKDDGVVEMVYEVAKEFRGQGYATATVNKLVEHVFDDEEVSRIDVRPLMGDSKSTGVLQRTGFVPPIGEEAANGIWSLTRDDLADLEARRSAGASVR